MFIKSISFHYLLKCVFIKVLSTAKLNGFFRGQNPYRQLSKSATRTMMNHRMQFLTSLLIIATTVLTLNIGTPRPATVVVLNIKQFNFTLK